MKPSLSPSRPFIYQPPSHRYRHNRTPLCPPPPLPPHPPLPPPPFRNTLRWPQVTLRFYKELRRSLAGAAGAQTLCGREDETLGCEDEALGWEDETLGVFLAMVGLQ
jgi:hypothetical protein